MLVDSIQPLRRGGRFINPIRSIDLRFIDDSVDFVRGPSFVPSFFDASFLGFYDGRELCEMQDREIPPNYIFERKVPGDPVGRVCNHFAH